MSRSTSSMRSAEWEEHEDASTAAAYMDANAEFVRMSRQMFDRLDRDDTGYLDRQEVAAAMKELGVPASPEIVEEWFQLSDRNHTNCVSFEEFLAFRLERRQQVKQLWDSMRRGGKGITSATMIAGLQELGIKATDDQIREQVRMVDSDGDGIITFTDFSNWLVLLPDVNARAVFDNFARISYRDDAQGEYTVPSPHPHGLSSAAMVSKLVCGGIAGMVSRTATAPIDRIKIIAQAAPTGASPPGLGTMVRQIVKEGGVPAFFRGNGANCVKIAPETGVKFVAFDVLKSNLAADPNNVTVSERFVAGGLAGATAQCAIYPLEIAKTRLALAQPGTYGGLASCLRTIRINEGVAALYAGLGTSIVGIIPYAAIDLACNSILKELVCGQLESTQGNPQKSQPAEPSVPVLLGCGVSSSTAAMLATYPINLIRTRLQAAGLSGGTPYTGPFDVINQTFAADGVRGFYRGLLPNMLKVLPATGISYSVFSVISTHVNSM